MGGAALGWLAWRDRSDALIDGAIGSQGLWLASLAGLVVGVLTSWATAWLARRWLGLQQIEAMVRRSLGAASDGAAITFVLIGAVAEELLFRLAAQDAFGVLGSVAICVGLHSCFGGFRLLPMTLFHSLLLSLMVHFGFGLLGSTTANAVMSHLNLRRIQCR
jgi:hypothetical protein